MKQVLFFRAEQKFKIPQADMFHCLGDVSNLNITSLDVGDSYASIVASFEAIERVIKRLLGYVRYDEKIYLCGAVSLGFVWLLKDFLSREFSEVRFIWLQMARQKGADFEKKLYEVWE